MKSKSVARTLLRLSLAFVWILLWAILGMLVASCDRSLAFRQDQEYTSSNSDSGYYGSRDGKDPIQHVESVGQPKKRVVVLDFWNDTPVPDSKLGGFAADELRRGLYLTQRVILSPEFKADRVTQDFIQGDEVKVAQLIREGRSLGVAVLAIGRVNKIAFRQKGDDIGLFREKDSLCGVNVEVKLFDVMGGREIMASARQGEADSDALVSMDDAGLESPDFRSELTQLAIRNAVAQLIPDVVKAVEKLSWQGRIAKITGNRVYVNAGLASGLVHGDILRVMTPGDDIYDPTTGAFLGRTRGQLKGTLEVVDFLGSDGAVTEIHTGGNFQEDDVVQLY